MKKISYGMANYNSKEITASLNVLKKQSLSLMDGKNVRKLENKISQLFGKKYALMVNSGSSANLLAIQSLQLKKESEIITPTLTFSTTISPIYQSGLKPNFIDKAIKSALNQSYNNIEIIIVDDASKDISKKVLKAPQRDFEGFRSLDSRRNLYQERPLGH